MCYKEKLTALFYGLAIGSIIGFLTFLATAPDDMVSWFYGK